MHAGERHWFDEVEIARNGSKAKGVERRDMPTSWVLRTDYRWVDLREWERGEMPDRLVLARAARD